jgi:ribosomal protein L7/L12
MQGDFEFGQLQARVLEAEKRLDFLYRHLGVEFVREIGEEDQRVADVLRTGNVIEAIKVYRDIHDVDLLSAKQAVEAMKSQMGL